MKFSFLFILVSLQVSARTYSQERITVDFQNVKLEKALKEVEHKSDYRFVYSSLKISRDTRITFRGSEVPVREVVDALLSKTGLHYRLIGERLVVITGLDERPPRKIVGKVSNENGEPLANVTVQVKGTETYTVTDANGVFQVNVDENATTLVFSYVDMEAQEADIAGRNTVDITLKSLNTDLGEVVVVGYGTQKKINLTGSVSTVQSADLTKASSANLSQTLAGRLPGLIVKQTSGEPGNDFGSINIRGFGNALVIVDGVESSMNNIDPNEIESVSILKDASAAIFGARAGNGVVLITTKRGTLSKPTITLNSSVAQQGLTVYPNLVNAGDYAELIREGQINVGVAPSSLRFSEEDVQKFKAGTEPGYEGSDWFNTVMSKYSPFQQHNLSFRGGNSAVRYFTFLGYTGQTGMYKSGDNQLNRYNIRSNIDAQITRDFSVGFDLSYIKTDLKAPNRPQVSLWQDLQESQPVYPSSLPDPSKIAYTGMVISTVASTTRDLGGYRDNNSNQIFSTLRLKYDLPAIEGLSVKGVLNYINNSSKSKGWAKQYSMWTYEPQSDTYQEKAGAISTFLSEGYGQTDNITGQLFLNYDRNFAQKHSVSGLLLTEVSSSRAQNISAGNNGFISTAIDYLFAGGATSQSSSGSASETGRLSYVGRVNYAYDNKYLLEATMRYDGSPKFPADRRWGFFPSVSAGWILSRESFARDINWLDNLKLRVSYSKSGYDGIGAFQYIAGFNFANRYVVNGETRTGLLARGLENLLITWEDMTIYNAGIDFSAFQNKFYGEFDVFYRDRRNILATRILSLPNTFGATLPQENINSQNNRGFELMLGYRNNISRDFRYDISGNISYARARWDHYEEPEYTDPDDIRINKVSGNWADRWFGYQSDGLFTSADEIAKHELDQDNQGNATLKPGDIKYVDQNGDNKLDWRDKVQIGTTSTPQVMFGINLNLAYRNFDLSILGQGATRYQYMLNLQTPNEGNIAQIIYDMRWTEANNNRDAKVPRVYIGSKPNNLFTSDYWLYNASYLRIKVLSLGYNLPSSLLNKVAFDNVRIYFSGTNLFTFSGMNKFSIDPEAPSGVRAGLSYPQQKILTLGLNVTF